LCPIGVGTTPKLNEQTIALGISEYSGGAAEGLEGIILCLGCQAHLLLHE